MTVGELIAELSKFDEAAEVTLWGHLYGGASLNVVSVGEWQEVWFQE